MQTFYLGTHVESWLTRAEFPLFISRRKLMVRKSFPVAAHRWALDSGAFSELSMFGKWTIGAREYADEVRRYRDAIGMMEWAAVQDWMCEPFMLKKTGLSTETHQERTTDNYEELLLLAPDIPWTPVLQGWTLADYLRHHEEYERRGLPLRDRVVGLGSVCRRQGVISGASLIRSIATSTGLRLHGFGVKTLGLGIIAPFLESADSMAWSYRGRRAQAPMPECTHKQCSNCFRFACQWRERLLRGISTVNSQLAINYS